MGRTEALWNKPYLFDPERFLGGNKISPFIFTAFQAGPRQCLGQNLALLEMKACIVRLLAKFEFVLEQDPNITYVNTLTLPVKGGVRLSAHRVAPTQQSPSI
jgi:cytochrome P450